MNTDKTNKSELLNKKFNNLDFFVYIKGKRENIANLAGKFIQELGDSDYCFKFNADNQATIKPRSEQFVFYTFSEPAEMNKIINVIQRTNYKNLELFVGSENINPFMKNIDGFIAYAPEVDGEYHNLNGGIEKITRSYNSLLAKTLEDYFTSSIREIVSKDVALSMKMRWSILC